MVSMFDTRVDKTAETLTGFVTVLPGAYSMVRFEAIEGEPLKHLFQKLTQPDLSGSKENMFLGEPPHLQRKTESCASAY